MRIFHIDFLNTENPLPDGNILGNQGEHNATILTITPPAEMTENENITLYRIAFELSNCRAVHSESIAKTDVVSFPLFSQITSSETISVQLEGYDNNGDLVVKSQKVTKLKFNPSVYGVETFPDSSPNSMAAEIAANTNFRKKSSYATVSLTNGTNCTAYSNLISGVTITLSEGIIPIGSEIKAIRFNYQGQWIDIRDMAAIDDYPYILNMHKVVYSQVIGEPVLAIVSFVSETNTVITALQNIEIEEIEVDYYTNL